MAIGKFPEAVLQLYNPSVYNVIQKGIFSVFTIVK